MKFIGTKDGGYINANLIESAEYVDGRYSVRLQNGEFYVVDELAFEKARQVLVPNHSDVKAFELHAFNGGEINVRPVRLIAWRILDSFAPVPVPVLSVEPSESPARLVAIEIGDDLYEIYENTANPFLIETYTTTLDEARALCLENYHAWQAKVEKRKAKAVK